jgi:glycosyltransferase involved in cell wall biosynthesis
MNVAPKRRKRKAEPGANEVILYLVGGDEGTNHSPVRAFPVLSRVPGEVEVTHLARVIGAVDVAIAAGGTHLVVPREHADWLGDNPHLTDYFAAYHELADASAETGVVFALRPAAESGAAAVNQHVAGVNVAGFLRLETGLGSAARGYVRALDYLGIPLAMRDLSDSLGFGGQDASLRDPRFGRELEFDVNLICVNAREHNLVTRELGAKQLKRRHNIGVWHWESPVFPEEWRARFADYDEIWVASSFVANILAPLSPIPIVRIPPALAPLSVASRARGRDTLGVGDDEFVFLFMFDFFSHFHRKNPLAIVEAFSRAFAYNDSVSLVIKCANAKSRPEEFGRLEASAHGRRIRLATGYWPQRDVLDALAACDAYVSLHRAEGLGLTLLEAMALGKPVIATAWSGNTDFMSVANSYPVRYSLVPLERNVGPYPAGALWAEPEVDHAAELMRRVFEDRDEAAATGAAGRAEIEANYFAAPVARLIAQRLALI